MRRLSGEGLLGSLRLGGKDVRTVDALSGLAPKLAVELLRLELVVVHLYDVGCGAMASQSLPRPQIMRTCLAKERLFVEAMGHESSGRLFLLRWLLVLLLSVDIGQLAATLAVGAIHVHSGWLLQTLRDPWRRPSLHRRVDANLRVFLLLLRETGFENVLQIPDPALELVVARVQFFDTLRV